MTSKEDGYVEINITLPDFTLDNNNYDKKEKNKIQQYSYDFTGSNNMGSYSYALIQGTIKPSTNIRTSLPPEPPKINASNLNLDVCQNACTQCVQPYAYSIGFIASAFGLIAGYYLFTKINYKNIFKRRRIKRKNSNRRRHIKEENTEELQFGINEYNSDFTNIL
jgi:hypothetical protein